MLPVSTLTPALGEHPQIPLWGESCGELAAVPTLVILDSRGLGSPKLQPILRLALQPGATAYVLYPQEGAIEVITGLLAATAAQRLVIVAHSEPEMIYLGAWPITCSLLQSQGRLLQEWGISEISLGGDNLQSDDRLVVQLAQLTGARVLIETPATPTGF